MPRLICAHSRLNSSDTNRVCTTQQAPSGEYWEKGYGRPLVAFTLNILLWAGFVVLAVSLSVACALASVALWLCGLWGITQWWKNEIATRTKGQRPRQRDWVFAETIVRRRNGGNLDDGERQFRVDLLLKETTGLDVEDLLPRIKRKEAMKHANDTQDDALLEVSMRHKFCRSSCRPLSLPHLSLSRYALAYASRVNPGYRSANTRSNQHSIGACSPVNAPPTRTWSRWFLGKFPHPAISAVPRGPA